VTEAGINIDPEYGYKDQKRIYVWWHEFENSRYPKSGREYFLKAKEARTFYHLLTDDEIPTGIVGLEWLDE